jgi:hypothetical protein
VDKWNGIKPGALAAVDFYTCYLTYPTNVLPNYNGAPNWVNSRTAYRYHRASGQNYWRILVGLGHQVFQKKGPMFCHARGIFVSVAQKIVITYEPRELIPDQVETATRQFYNAATVNS